MKIRVLLPVAATLLAASLSAALGQGPIAPVYYNFNTPVLQAGETVTGTLSQEDGQNFKDGTRVHVWYFTGGEGEQVNLSVGSDDFDTWLTVYAPDGSILDWNDDSWNATFPLYWESSLDLELPADGRYTAIVTSYSAQGLGDYALLLTRIEPDEPYNQLGRIKEDEVLTVGSSHKVQLDESLPVTGEGYDGPSRLYDLHVAEDMLVMIEASGTDVDAVLMLYDGADNIIDWNDTVYDPQNPDNYWPARLTLPLTAGDYQLLVGGYASYDIGNVTLTITGYQPLH